MGGTGHAMFKTGKNYQPEVNVKKLIALMFVACFTVALAQEDGGVFPPTPGPNGDGMIGSVASTGGEGGEEDGGVFPPTPGPNGDGMFG